MLAYTLKTRAISVLSKPACVSRDNEVVEHGISYLLSAYIQSFIDNLYQNRYMIDPIPKMLPVMPYAHAQANPLNIQKYHVYLYHLCFETQSFSIASHFRSRKHSQKLPRANHHYSSSSTNSSARRPAIESRLCRKYMAKPTIVRTRKSTMIMIATTMLRWTMVGGVGGALVDLRWCVGDEVGRSKDWLERRRERRGVYSIFRPV